MSTGKPTKGADEHGRPSQTTANDVSLPLASVEITDASNLPWGTLRQEAQRVLWALDEMQSALPEKLSLMQMKMDIAVTCLAKACSKLGLLPSISPGPSQPGRAIIGRQPFEMSLALELGKAADALFAQMNSYKPRGAGHNRYPNPIVFKPELINAVRKAAERLPETPLAKTPLYRVRCVDFSVPPGKAVKLPMELLKADGGEQDTSKLDGKERTETAAVKPVGTVAPKRPSDAAFIVYRYWLATGKKQTELARDPELMKLLKSTVTQGTVSRRLKQVTKWVEIGNILPDLLNNRREKPAPIDPERIDLGQHQEGRTKRQRKRRSE